MWSSAKSTAKNHIPGTSQKYDCKMGNVTPIVEEVKKIWRAVADTSAGPARTSHNGPGSNTLPGQYCYLLNVATQQFDYTDPGITTVLDINPVDFNMQTLYSMIHPDDQEGMKWKEKSACDFLFRRISAAERARYKISYVFRVITSAGTEKKILHQAELLSDERGTCSHLLCTHTDISHLEIERYDHISFIGKDGVSAICAQETNPSGRLQKIQTPDISVREREILQQLALGLSSKQVAGHLNISLHTVDTHRRNLLRKTGTKNTLELSVWCAKLGII